MAAGILAGKIAPAAKMESSGALGRMEQKPWTLFFMGRQHWKRSHCIVYIVLQLGKFYLCVYCPIGKGTRKHGKNRIPNQVPVLICRLFFCDLAQCCLFLLFPLGAL